MTLWDLPGVKRFVESECEAPLRDGASVIARFPGAVPIGFEDAVTGPLENYLTVGKVRATAAPLEGLWARFAAGGPAHVRTIQELCMDRGFGGRLIWVDGLNASNWTAWRAFLIHYAQVSRSMPLAGRTLFFAPLTGPPSDGFPASDVALATFEWNGVPDELDLMLLASERLAESVGSAVLRTLLTTVVARVASWDFDSAAQMLAGDRRGILDPVKTLREIACAKEWTQETPVSWELGTASKTGVAHPARAALDNPPREIERRIWSAQASVLLPWFETLRHQIIEANSRDVRRQMRQAGIKHDDPYDLELGDLASIFGRRGAGGRIRERLRKLQAARNSLAHLQPLAPDRVLWMIESNGG